MSTGKIILLSAVLLGACGAEEPPAITCELQFGARPPAWVGPPDTEGPSGAVATFALSEMSLGGESPDAWRSLGFDLDGLARSLGAACGCANELAPKRGASSVDGLEGTDNTLGQDVVPFWFHWDPLAESCLNDAIAAGALNLAFRLEGLRLPSETSYPLRAEALATGPLGAALAFDGSDVLPYDPAEPPAVFDHAYVAGEVAVLEGATLPLPLLIFEQRIVLHVHEAIVTLELDPTRERVVSGMLAGILDVEELATAAYQVLAPSQCDAALESVEVMRTAADILLDGTQRPGFFCDGVSLGVGFRGVRVGIGTAVAPPELPPPCPGPPE